MEKKSNPLVTLQSIGKEKQSLKAMAVTILLCTLGNLVFAAGLLTGKVLDNGGKPVAYANVTLQKANDSSFVAGALTGNDGTFTILSPVAGRYRITVSAIGFESARTSIFQVAGTDGSMSVDTIVLQASTKLLKEVTVNTLRPTIVQQADRMVISIEGTALAAGNSAFTVLSRSPGVFVDHEGNIQLNGRSGVTIMINGKLTYLSLRDLRTLLEGMPAENIRNIEIITNPSSKYDAEGSSGIINMNLKKYDRQGMNGSYYTSYSYNGKQHGYSAGGNMNYKSGKWNAYLNADFSRRVGGREATFTRIFYASRKTTYFDQVATGNWAAIGPPAARTGIDYEIDPRQSIGLMVSFNTNNLSQDFLTDTYIGFSKGAPEVYIDADNLSTNRATSITANMHYQLKTDTLGSLFSADIDGVKIRNKGASNFYNYYDTLKNNGFPSTDFLYTYTPNGYDILSAKIDFTKMIGPNGKFEMGAKASSVFSDNDSRFYFNNRGLVLDSQRTNHFKYSEKIYAAYVNMNLKAGNKVTLQGGLRAEQTNSIGNSITTGLITRRSYLNLFPSLFVQHTVSSDYQVNYSYSRRIQRPNYGNMNPFRFYRDPYTWIEGNPYLRPQYAHSFSLAQTFYKNYTLTLAYQLTKDVISELPMLDVEKATTIYYTGNVDDGHNISLTALAPFRILKNWETQNTVLVAYNKFSMTSNTGALVNDKIFYMVQSNQTITLPWQFRVELNILYRGPAASGLYQLAPMSRVDLGVKKTLMNKKLDVSLNIGDIFKGYRFRFSTDIAGNINEFDQYLRFRTIAATLRYNFSRGQKVDVKRRNNSLEELNRTGN